MCSYESLLDGIHPFGGCLKIQVKDYENARVPGDAGSFEIIRSLEGYCAFVLEVEDNGYCCQGNVYIRGGNTLRCKDPCVVRNGERNGTFI